MPTQSVAHTTETANSQNGTYQAGGWIQGTGELDLYGGAPFPSWIGLVFSWELSVNSLGTVLDPPVFSPTLTLELTTHPNLVADPGAESVNIYAVPEVAPLNDSSALAPMARGELLVGVGTFGWTGVGTVFTTFLGNTAATLANLETMRLRYWGSALWSGRMAFTLEAAGFASAIKFNGASAVGTAPTLTVVETAFHTGRVGEPFEGRSRHCPRSGLPLRTDHAIEDGYRRGLWVRQQSWDPRDELEERQYYPSPDEGTHDDEVQ